MNKTILFYAVFSLSILNISALDITTSDGRIYKNVKVTNVMPDAVGFMYTKKDGTPVIRDVKMALLTNDLQKKFHYSPKKAKIFKRQVADFQEKRNQILQKHHQEDLALFRKQKKFAIELNHIKALLYAHRLKCFIHIVRPVGEDCIGKISMHRATDKYGRLGTAYIRNLTGPQNQLLTTTIYPTGETISFQDGMFPVYNANLTKYALQLAEEHKIPSTGNSSGLSGKKMFFPVNAPKAKKKITNKK